jgi:2-polyprenyl-6-methoxyphenol hydroxylase-like FAD-dependent oxidoreductase
MMRGMIIGSGVGGLTTAMAMQQRGMAIKVYTEKETVTSGNAGIVLAVNAMRLLDKMQLADEIYLRGNELKGMHITNEALTPISGNVISHFSEKYHYTNVAVHPAVLYQILLQHIKDEVLETRKQCVRITERSRETIAEFADGMSAYGDYIIAADGIHSIVRKQLFPEATVRDVKQICWGGIIAFDLPLKYRHYAIEAWGRGKRFGFVPLDKDNVYWYALINKHGNGFEFRADLKKELDHQFREFAPLVRQLMLDTPKTDILRDDLLDMKPLKRWYAGRICLLGDAAHAVTPNIGQGVSQAIEDAWMMASLMDQYKNPVYVFPLFQRSRKVKTDYVAKLSYRIGQMAHYENRLLVGMRNQMMKSMPKVFTKKQFDKIFAPL